MKYLVKKEVVAAIDEDTQILKQRRKARRALNERPCTICGRKRDAGSMTHIITITLYKMNHVRLQIVQNECEQIFSVAQTADAKLVDDVL